MEKVQGLPLDEEEFVRDLKPVGEMIKSIQAMASSSDQHEVLILRERRSGIEDDIIVTAHAYPSAHNGLHLVKGRHFSLPRNKVSMNNSQQSEKELSKGANHDREPG